MIRKIKRLRDIVTIAVLSAIMAASTVLYIYVQSGTSVYGQDARYEYTDNNEKI